jgi:hypothetical protein
VPNGSAATVEHAQRGGHDAPIIEQQAGASPRRFVIALLVAAFALVGSAATLNVLVDPYGELGTGLIPSGAPRDAGIKANLVSHLSQPPQLVVLGSSRALKIEPQYMRSLTGLRTFNAAIRDATPVDSYAFMRLIHDHFPQSHPHYLWLLDVEAFRSNGFSPGLRHTPSLLRYVKKISNPGVPWSDALPRMLTWQETEDSARLLHAWYTGHLNAGHANRERRLKLFDPDGFFRITDYNWNRSFNKYVAWYKAGYPALQQQPKQFMERAIAQMNRWGATPVIVLTPIHPKLRKVVGPMGWTARHRDLVAYLHGLQGRLHFQMLDLSDPTVFGGSLKGFYDPVHMRIPNVRRMLDYVVAHTNALQ